jgi:hypothetical protein
MGVGRGDHRPLVYGYSLQMFDSEAHTESGKGVVIDKRQVLIKYANYATMFQKRCRLSDTV